MQKIKIDSYDALPLEKTLTLHNIIISTESVFNKDQTTTTIIYSQKNVHINNTNMLYNDRINVSEGIDINKTNASKYFFI